MGRRLPCLPLLLLAAACGGEGSVLVDLCAPAGVTDPFETAAAVRIDTTGDVTRTTRVELADPAPHLGADPLPLGAHVVLEVELINHLGGVLATGRTDRLEVLEQTEVCLCLTRPGDADACRGIGCRYLPAEDRCTFFER